MRYSSGQSRCCVATLHIFQSIVRIHVVCKWLRYCFILNFLIWYHILSKLCVSIGSNQCNVLVYMYLKVVSRVFLRQFLVLNFSIQIGSVLLVCLKFIYNYLPLFIFEICSFLSFIYCLPLLICWHPPQLKF